MASSLATLQGLHGHGFLQRSNPKQSNTPQHHRKSTCRAEFNILKVMGGRGLCNGEIGIQKELLKKQLIVDDDIHHPSPEAATEAVAASSEKEELENSEKLSTSSAVEVAEDAFEKEMMGLTGGFPGGEKGLLKFIHDQESK